ncbi:MAG: crosslink repair DNA glycosylase YcaQ family protein [Candidatus Promineifilaceae bacterium]|nr:crosslink repair DNA glycosylase YcaQ family protein [Candidatus Promineifilaceae bacterium]
MTRLSLTPQLARRLAVHRQRLSGPTLPANRDGLLTLFADLGCVQIDPIRAVERTQYLVPWSRLGPYDLTLLDDLVYKERRLFEYWAHAASIVRTADYPLFATQMRSWSLDDSDWSPRVRQWLQENPGLDQYVLNELRQNGPLTVKDFDDRATQAWESSGWTSGRSIGLMLDVLWMRGQVFPSRRQGNKKYWDLAERILPDRTPEQGLGWPETVRLAAQRALRALGVARPRHIKAHFTRKRYPDLDAILGQLLAEERIVPVDIIAEDGPWPGNWLIHSEDMSLVDELSDRGWQPRTTLLSPFDNLICDRDRTEQLFNFHFRIEIYVPKAKRQYGYYVLPILHGERLIGRVDPRMDRKRGELQVNGVYAEPDAPPEAGPAIRAALGELAGFLEASTVSYGQPPPTIWRAALQ